MLEQVADAFDAEISDDDFDEDRYADNDSRRT
jgi:hypothetical protein